MMRLGRILVLLLCGALVLGLSACAWSGGPGSQTSRSGGGYYGGGSVHYNSFPRAYGYNGPYYVGRPY
jgi:hypothetical protein